MLVRVQSLPITCMINSNSFPLLLRYIRLRFNTIRFSLQSESDSDDYSSSDDSSDDDRPQNKKKGAVDKDVMRRIKVGSTRTHVADTSVSYMSYVW